MIRSLLAGASAAILAAATAPCATAQEAGGQQLGTVHFETSCNDIAQRRFDRAMRYQHSFWYRASKEIFEDVLKADPQCAIAYWGIAQSLLLNPFGVPPRGQSGARARRAREGEGHRRQDAARERIHRRARGVLHRLRQARSPHPRRTLPQGDAGARRALPAGRRSANLLRPGARRGRLARRQDLCQPAQGGGDPGGNIQAPAAASRRRPLPHPLLRLSADRGERSRRRHALLQDRADGAARPAHAVPHLHPRRLLEGVDRRQLASVRAAKADKEYGDQLHGQDYLVYAYLQLAQDKDAARYHRRDGGGGRPQSRPSRRRASRSPRRPRATWSSAGTGAAPRNCRCGRAKFAHVMAITHFARALGAARSGKPDAAKADIAKLAELRDKLRAGEGRLLGRAGRHPVADRDCLAALRARPSTTTRSRR